MGHIAEGARIVFGDRRFLRYMIVPWLWSTLIFAAVVVVGYFALVPWLQGMLTPPQGDGPWYLGPLRGLVAFAYLAIWFFIAGFVFLTITSLTSSFLWEKLSAAVEEHLTGARAPLCTLPGRALFWDAMLRGSFAIVMAIFSLFCGWFVPVLGPVILAGWVGLLDYTGPAFLRYNRAVGQQWPVATKMKGWFSFQLVAGALTLLPVVNVFVLPVLVAGGTVMAVRSKVLS